MARKFIQMGMTRAKRYANYKGGRKYISKGRVGKIEKSRSHQGKEEKEMASLIFREVWERCKAFEGYIKLREQWQAEMKSWENLSEKEKEKIRLAEDNQIPKSEEIVGDTNNEGDEGDKKVKIEED